MTSLEKLNGDFDLLVVGRSLRRSPFRDAWKDAEGLPAKDAREKYTQELIKVSYEILYIFLFLRVYAPKVLKRVDDEQSKKYIAEIEAAA